MRTIAWILGILVVAGLIVMAAAGFTAATAILVTAGAIVGMIGLGNLVGGRTTPNKAPTVPGSGSAPDGAETADVETADVETADVETANAEMGDAGTVDSEVGDGGAGES